MLEILKSQFQNPKVLCQQRTYMTFQPPRATHLASDMYPLWQEYYHELNPGFLFKIPRPDYLNFFPVMTVRDGAVSFASFILRNPPAQNKIKTHFIIPPELGRFLPPQIKSQFSGWSILQKNQMSLSETKKVFIAGFATTQTLPSLEGITNHLSVLKQTPKDCQIEVFLPIRNDPFSERWQENQLAYKTMDILQTEASGRKITFITAKEVMERANWKGIYFLDLMTEDFILSDSYLRHFVASRGGSVAAFSTKSNPNTQFELSLSLNHKLQVFPLPEVESLYVDMVFYQKRSHASDYTLDPAFHALIRRK